ncbi:MAG: flagellin lysine-N-methylase [Clostridia bacterium]|nr:flagellin lysine-N-methylase [Clostridia bacterium]
MITRYPSYYKDFKCIASKCTRSCCSVGWEIIIDKNTADYYKSVSGEFGEKLRTKVDYSNPTKFIIESNGKCPFLNNNNLCDIYIKLGPEHVCQICQEHPRFYECYNNVIECGLGMYCEEACRIMLSQKEAFSMYEEETTETVEKDYSEDVFKYLCDCRLKIFNYLSDKSIDINQRIADILWFGNVVQQNIDSDMLDDEEIFSVTSNSSNDIEPIFKYLLSLEPNDTNWFNYLNDSLTIYKNNLDKFKDFEIENPDISLYLKNIADYFIYRYFIRGIFQDDVLSVVKLMAMSVAVLKTLFFCKWIEKKSLTLMDCVMIAKIYSEEIECSDDNILNIHIACYEISTFSTENLLGLFV